MLAARKVRCCTKSNSREKEAGSVKRVKEFDLKCPTALSLNRKFLNFVSILPFA